MTPVASGKLSNAGYYTIPFDKQIALDAGERYAVVLFISTPDAVHPLAIEYEADDATADVVLDDGEGYVSANGFEWENVKNVENCNICIIVRNIKNPAITEFASPAVLSEHHGLVFPYRYSSTNLFCGHNKVISTVNFLTSYKSKSARHRI